VQKVTPFLWFDGKAAEAANFYVSIFKNSKILSSMRTGEGGPSRDGAIMSVNFEIDGREFIAFNGGPHFQFSPAISLFVRCETQGEVDELWEKLGDGGKPQQCGWLQDKYGVSWQIIPAILGELLRSKDAEKTKRAMNAMMNMEKLDIEGLKKAYDGHG
jgi:predicted 3-demethylubiquinone-9 3-methyltransferase (glyoxalase superfamily)